MNQFVRNSNRSPLRAKWQWPGGESNRNIRRLLNRVGTHCFMLDAPDAGPDAPLAADTTDKSRPTILTRAGSTTHKKSSQWDPKQAPRLARFSDLPAQAARGRTTPTAVSRDITRPRARRLCRVHYGLSRRPCGGRRRLALTIHTESPTNPKRERSARADKSTETPVYARERRHQAARTSRRDRNRRSNGAPHRLGAEAAISIVSELNAALQLTVAD